MMGGMKPWEENWRAVDVPDDGDGLGVMFETDGGPIGRAHMKLAAAAPELYRAVDQLIAVVVQLSTNDVAMDAVDAGQAALRKARGE